MSISENGVWGAQLKDGSHLSSYEVLGYHACTADLLRGLLDSGVPIRVYRRHGGPVWVRGARVSEAGVES